MILFLDNDPQRAVMAFNRMSEEDRSNTIWCRTVEEAIATLRDYPLTKVYMEHDLCGEFANTKREDCGMEVIRYLEKLDEKQMSKFLSTRFTIHTWNDHAGPIMVERLLKLGLDARLKPFGM